MKAGSRAIIDELMMKNPALNYVKGGLEKIIEIMLEAINNGKKLLFMGNGGSACDCEHIVGEFVKSFYNKRTIKDSDVYQYLADNNQIELADKLQYGIKAFSLVSQTGIITAIDNDIGGDYIFSQQIMAYADEGDVVVGLTTSGNSKNIYNGFYVACAKKAHTILLSGKDGGICKDIAEVSLIVKSDETHLIQEEHIKLYHAICLVLENEIFG
ncbi:MAG TPA: SIS domain-containing protein [Clostridia bacterium]